MRWSVDLEDRTNIPDGLTHAGRCSHAGIRQVAIVTFDESLPPGDDTVDVRLRACSPPSFDDEGATVAGPNVDPGLHRVMTLGLTANGQPWLEDERPERCQSVEDCGTGFDCVGEPMLRCDAAQLELDPDGCQGFCEPLTDCTLSDDPANAQPCPIEFTCEDVPEDGCPDTEGNGTCPGTCEPRPLSQLIRCAEDPSRDSGFGCVLDLEGPGAEQLAPLACDCFQVNVREERTALLKEFVLDAPPDCEDGIDNDLDGLLDFRDPGCRLPGADQGSEFLGVEEAQIDLTLTLLGRNRSASCPNLGVTRFESVLDGDESTRRSFSCNVLGERVAISEIAEPGTHTLEVVAIGRDGMPATRAEGVVVQVPSITSAEIDFAASEFLEPIEAPIQFRPNFAEGFSDTDIRECAGATGQLDIDQIRVRVLDAHGGTLAEPVNLEDGTPLDGATPIACPSAALRTEPLTWGGYLLQIDALTAEGAVCFSTDSSGPIPAAPSPQSAFGVFVPRVLVPGENGLEPPEGCRECEQDSDCGGELRCDRGLCVG